MAYEAEAIQVLEGLDPVRKRPGMYIGSTSTKGLHHLLYEVLDNSIDEVQTGNAENIRVEVNKGTGWVTVSDDGRGIPVDLHPQTGKTALETVLTVLHAGGKFGAENSAYTTTGGLHGVGLSVVNALSESLKVSAVVGTLLTAINQGDLLLKGRPGRWLGLTYCVRGAVRAKQRLEREP